MSLYPCPRQHEVRAALRQRRWAEQAHSELHMHVESCASCKELLLLTQTLQQARQEVMSMAQLPSPGLLWWKAQIRRRQKLIERAEKPVAFFEVLAIAATLLVIVTVAISERSTMANWLGSLANTATIDFSQIDTLHLTSNGAGIWVILGVATMVLGLIGGLAAYLMMREE